MDERRFRIYVSIIVGLFVFTSVRLATETNPIYDAGEPVFSWLNEFSADIALTRSAGENTSKDLQSQNELLAKQNQDLRAELELKSGRTTTNAEVTRRDLLGFRKQVWVNVGEDAGVTIGQTVTHRGALFGVVSEVYDTSALIETVLDPNFRATVTIDEEQGVLKVEHGSLIADLVPSKELTGKAIHTNGLDGQVEASIFVGTTGESIANSSQVFGSYNVFLPYNVFDVSFVDIVESEQRQ